jgi:3-phosphoshikimate 1-carboxyvinyltransferase
LVEKNNFNFFRITHVALPDLIEIVPLEEPVRAEITVPGSKSITNRALILAALADGEVTLTGALWSEDTQIMVECLQKLGFEIRVENDPAEFCNRTITVKGLGGKIPNAGTIDKPLELFVGNAGTAARFLSAFVCLGDGVYRLSGVARMHERPQAALFSALRELGYRVESENGNDKLPVKIYGRDAVSASQNSGEKIRDGDTPSVPKKFRVSIEESSQFASALLLCAKIGNWKIEVVGENAEESPYVAMTVKLMEAFPKNGGTLQIEPDASSGSYFWASGQITPKSEDFPELSELKQKLELSLPEPFRLGHVVHGGIRDVEVLGWPKTGWQIDEKFKSYMVWGPLFHDFPTYLKQLLALVKRGGLCDPKISGEIYAKFIQSSKGEVSRAVDLGDSIMTAIAIAPLERWMHGKEFIKFTDLGRLRVQETERVVALRTELTKCGAKVVEEGDTLTVWPSPLHGAEIETYNDHRMAMCFAILGLKVPGIKIKNPACVKKTFPNFFQKLAAPPPHGLGATILDAKSGRKLTQEELFAD